MKTILPLLCAVIFLGSCASIPAPRDSSDALVVGLFSLYFPDGYFDSPLTTIDTAVELDFHDVTTGGVFSVFTGGGVFRFLARGNDTYTLVSSRAMISDGSRRYVVGPRAIGLEFTPTAGTVFSLGSIRLTYTHPAKMLTVYPELDYETRGGGGMNVPTTQGGAWRTVEFYDVTVSRKIDTAAVRDYLRRADANGPWISRDIVEMQVRSSVQAAQ